MIGIYLIQNQITKRAYIGQSCNISNRRRTHKWKLRNNIHPNTHLQASWNKYGEESFEFIVLETISNLSFLTVYEQSYINYYRTLAGGVYNQIGPADNPTRGKKLSINHKEKLSKANIGKTLTVEHKALLSTLLKQRRSSMATIRKPIQQLSMDGEVINTWPSARAAIGFSYKCISLCCLYKLKSHKGYRWKFAEID